MQAIWKFEIDHQFELHLPDDYRVLHVSSQDRLEISRGGRARFVGTAYMWIQMDLEAPQKPVQFAVVMTGEEVKASNEYIGTFMLRQGGFVGHLFKVNPEKENKK